jgi:hypothetical protein
VEAERHPALLEHRIELHVAVVVYRPVADGGDHEADHAFALSEVLDDRDAGLRLIERQIRAEEVPRREVVEPLPDIMAGVARAYARWITERLCAEDRSIKTMQRMSDR